jgi:S1-C subfamily serine protease
VLPTAPAELAGLRPGDLIVSVDGRPVATASDLVRSIASGGIGNETLLEVSRQGTWLEVELTIEEEPPREVLAELEESGAVDRPGR